MPCPAWPHGFQKGCSGPGSPIPWQHTLMSSGVIQIHPRSNRCLHCVSNICMVILPKNEAPSMNTQVRTRTGVPSSVHAATNAPFADGAAQSVVQHGKCSARKDGASLQLTVSQPQIRRLYTDNVRFLGSTSCNPTHDTHGPGRHTVGRDQCHRRRGDRRHGCDVEENDDDNTAAATWTVVLFRVC